MAIPKTGNDNCGNFLFISGQPFYNECKSMERTVENP